MVAMRKMLLSFWCGVIIQDTIPEIQNKTYASNAGHTICTEYIIYIQTCIEHIIGYCRPTTRETYHRGIEMCHPGLRSGCRLEGASAAASYIDYLRGLSEEESHVTKTHGIRAQWRRVDAGAGALGVCTAQQYGFAIQRRSLLLKRLSPTLQLHHNHRRRSSHSQGAYNNSPINKKRAMATTVTPRGGGSLAAVAGAIEEEEGDEGRAERQRSKRGMTLALASSYFSVRQMRPPCRLITLDISGDWSFVSSGLGAATARRPATDHCHSGCRAG